METTSENENLEKTEYQLFVKGPESKSQLIRTSMNATVSELTRAVKDRIRLPDDFYLVYSRHQLAEKNENGKVMRLNDYGIGDESTISVFFRVYGGSAKDYIEKVYGPLIKLTSKMDMISLDDEEGGQRTEMPCGHAIGPDSLTDYVFSELNKGEYDICCPGTQDDGKYCKSSWHVTTLRKVALFTREETRDFDSKCGINFIESKIEARQCPRCMSYIDRKDKTNPRVICSFCTKQIESRYEFCWKCLQKWKSPGKDDCGNASCKDSYLSVLQDCPTKKIGDIEGCPSKRACPRCGTLMHHIEKCKQMVCIKCKKSFCFICLGKGDENGTFPCGSYNSICQVAPRQTTLPN